jgi:hypothetical protein
MTIFPKDKQPPVDFSILVIGLKGIMVDSQSGDAALFQELENGLWIVSKCRRRPGRLWEVRMSPAEVVGSSRSIAKFR